VTCVQNGKERQIELEQHISRKTLIQSFHHIRDFHQSSAEIRKLTSPR
jgi:hypothetical protein